MEEKLKTPIMFIENKISRKVKQVNQREDMLAARRGLGQRLAKAKKLIS